MIAYVIEQLFNGLIIGSLYALIAIGFTMVYGILRLINFAHGDVVMIGAFATLGLVFLRVPWPVLVLVVLLAGAAVGIAIDKIGFRPMRGAPQVTGFIASLALSILIQNLGIVIFTAQPRNFFFPDSLQRIVKLGGLSLRTLDIVIIALAVVLMVALLLIVRRTRLGVAMRATAENLNVSRLMGIKVNRIIMITFAIGSAMAAFAGLLWGGKFGQIDPLMGFLPGLKAFVAAVIGGVGSLTGAMLGGFILGFAEVLFVGLLPSGFSAYRDAFVFGLLILILLVLPSGLFGKEQKKV
jgi:branched-chain amino acid transport system permease protein